MRIEKQELKIKMWRFLRNYKFSKIDDDDYCFMSDDGRWFIVVDDYIWLSERVVDNNFILQNGKLGFIKFKALFEELQK
jgi:uncharacterized protein YdeI (BOF family)